MKDKKDYNLISEIDNDNEDFKFKANQYNNQNIDTFTNEHDKVNKSKSMDQTDLELKKEDDYNDDIEANKSTSRFADFIFYITIILFSINLILYIPLIVIFKHIQKPTDFEQFWWISFIGIICLVVISLWVYISKATFLRLDYYLTFIVFPIFVLLIIGVISVFASYNFTLCFSLNIITSIGFTICLFLHYITSINNLNCFKVFIIYLFVIISNMLFIVFQKDYYVEFFTISVFISMLFTYLLYKLHDLFSEFLKVNAINSQKEALTQYLTAVMLLFTHMVICMFKDY